MIVATWPEPALPDEFPDESLLMVAWCRQHDWGVNAWYDPECDVIRGVRDQYVDHEGGYHDEPERDGIPANWDTLRAWAGY